MANEEYLKKIKQGVKIWNKWREERIVPYEGRYFNLRNAKLSGIDLEGANLSRVDFYNSDLSEANLNNADISEAYLVDSNLNESYLRKANLSNSECSGVHLFNAFLPEANLNNAKLQFAYLVGADLHCANLRNADLFGANLHKANLRNADLSNSYLEGTSFVETNLIGTTLNGSNVYGISCWNIKTSEKTNQKNLKVTKGNEPVITVDNLEVAQFIYLLLNNRKIREVIDTITSKLVLILGRFAPKRKRVLDSIKIELRKRNYLPVLFDFEKPAGRDITETISILAHMARFIIADITDAKSVPQELIQIVPNLPSVPVQPILLESQKEYGMFEHFARFPWVLDIYLYHDINELISTLSEKIITPIEIKVQSMRDSIKP
jgi:uncharacterized protein YjbI with pentapeptide repeats